MKALIRHSLSIGTRIAVGLVLLIALAVSGIRIALPMLSERVAEIEAQLAELLGQPIEVGAVEAEWTVWGPLLQLSEVGIYDPGATRIVLEMERLAVQLDIWRSLATGQVVPRQLVVSGTALEIHRRADTSVQIIGLDVAGMTTDDGLQGNPWSGLRDVAYRLDHSTVRWRDDITGADYAFDDVSLLVDLRPSADRLSVAGFVSLPPELGETLEVALDLEGDLLAPRGWRGRHYLKAVGTRLEGLPSAARLPDVGVVGGNADLELWGRWSAGDLVDLRGRVQAREVTLDLSQSETPGSVTRFAGLEAALFIRRLEQGWRFDIEDLRVSRAGLEWGPTGISVETLRAGAVEQLRVGADFARVQDLVPLWLARTEISPEHRALAEALRPAGDLRDLRLNLRLEADTEPEISARGEFRDVGFQAHQDAPGATGLSGAFSLHQGGGELVLDSASVEFDYPSLFERPLWMDTLAGAVEWSFRDSGLEVVAHDLRARNQDLETHTRLRLDLGSEGAFMDLQVRYGEGNLGRAYQYLPFTLPRDVDQWLGESIVSGRIPEGGLLFHGNVADFPFDRGQGVFEARFELEDLELAYHPDWPRITALDGEAVFRNDSFLANLRSGNAYRLLVDRARVEIPDFDDAHVLVDVSTQGPLQDAFRFVRESPLRQGHEPLLEDLVSEGVSRLSVNIDLPLDEAKADQTRVQGRLDMRGCALGLRSANLYFGAIQGALDFTESGFSADQITAEFRGSPVTVMARNPVGAGVIVDIAGNLSTSRLIDSPDPLIDRTVSGSSYWLARLTIPGFAEDAGKSRLRLQSDLVGTAIELPEPVGKTADARRDFVLETGLSAASPLYVEFGSHSAAMELAPDAGEGKTIRRAELRLNDHGARVPDDGIVVRGQLARLAISEWEQALATDEDSTSSGRQDRAAFVGGVSEIDFSADELELWGHQTRNVKVHALRDRSGWRGLISTSMLSGTVQLPGDLRSGVPLVMELEHLEVDGGDASEDLPRLDPRDIPALRITSKTLVSDGRRFEDFRLEATRVWNGLVIHNLQLSAPDLSARVTGDWRVTRNGQQSIMRLELESADFGEAFTALGLDSGLTGGEGKLIANLRWPDAPTGIGWDGLEGTAQVDIEDGRFENLDPGAGRLLGLINLQFLPRRLTLDFSDIFREGYSFDSIRGSYTIRGSGIYTTDTEIIGPAADVGITGRTDARVEEYDQVVTVTPHLKSTLPIAGFLVGGLPVGAAVFLADSVFNVGKGLDRASRITYRVTGSWDDPQVDVLSAPETEDAFPDDAGEFPRE